jgi:hypothetical protein
MRVRVSLEIQRYRIWTAVLATDLASPSSMRVIRRRFFSSQQGKAMAESECQSPDGQDSGFAASDEPHEVSDCVRLSSFNKYPLSLIYI